VSKRERGVVRLRVIGGDTIEIREGVPATRAHCKDGPRPCPYVRCKWHLWRVDSADRAGKPHDGKRAGTTLRPAWLEWPLPPSCALDFIEAGESSTGAIARALGTHRGNVWLIWNREHVRAAFERLRELLRESASL
jgi:hypothetical protein